MFSFINQALRALRARHEKRAAIQALEVLNDHQLADIGIERGFIVEAVYGEVPQFESSARNAG